MKNYDFIKPEWIVGGKDTVIEWFEELERKGANNTAIILESVFRKPIPPTAEGWDKISELARCEIEAKRLTDEAMELYYNSEARRLTDEAMEQYEKMFELLDELDFKGALLTVAESEAADE